MNKDLEVRSVIEINADRTKVWHALITPEIIKKYLFGTDTITTWAIGSPIVFQGEWGGKPYRDHGVIDEFKPFEKISYSYWSGFTGLEDKPENYSQVSYELSGDKPDVTTFTWVQRGFVNQDGYEHSKNGMEVFLAEIKSIIENT